MSDRRAALRSYFLEVVRDLVQRGVLRQQAGQSLADVLRVEMRVVLGDVQADFAAVAAEIGVGLLGGVEAIVSNRINTFVGGVGRAIAERFAQVGSKPR